MGIYNTLLEDFYDEREESERKLSGGQRQRVCICRSLLRDTKIIIMDEPTSGLDKVNIEKLKEIIRKEDRTMIIVSHDEGMEDVCNSSFSI